MAIHIRASTDWGFGSFIKHDTLAQNYTAEDGSVTLKVRITLMDNDYPLDDQDSKKLTGMVGLKNQVHKNEENNWPNHKYRCTRK